MVTAIGFGGMTAAAANDDPALVEAAVAEGSVTIYHATDAEFSQPLFDAFTAKYGIAVEGMDLGVSTTYNRIISEAAAGQVTADIAWSSAMDTMMSLAANGYAEQYVLSDKAAIPEWAIYEDMLFGTTVEPFGVLYNTNQIAEGELPDSYADLITYLARDELNGKVATYDPERAGAALLAFAYSSEHRDDFWALAESLGAADVKLYSGSGSVRESVLSGENALAVYVIGSYAIA
jgi:iron(III) transport system substrate-binding protein